MKGAAGTFARRTALLDDEIAELDIQLTPLVAAAAPRTTTLLGISTGHPASCYRLPARTSNGFAAKAPSLPSAAPVRYTIASGKHGRYRLNGRRSPSQLRLDMIAVCRLRHWPKTRAYAERRTAEGNAKTS